MRLRGPRAGQPERGGVRGRGDGRAGRSEQRQRLLQRPPSRRRSTEECQAQGFGLPGRPHGPLPASGPQPSTRDRLQPRREASPRDRRAQAPPSRAPGPAPRGRRCHTPGRSRALIGRPPSAAPPPPATGAYVTSPSASVRGSGPAAGPERFVSRRLGLSLRTLHQAL
uniref:proline-rich proteoglycan 2-like n=1 Tax=Nyctereutes procyonoides TaxID=34880 RepID=UPI00244458EF|nr:proline-rich proteoglycan 2-like [Nyctereutes procyonoides]